MNSTYCVVYENDAMFGMLVGWILGALVGGIMGVFLWKSLVKFDSCTMYCLCGYLYMDVIGFIGLEMLLRIKKCDDMFANVSGVMTFLLLCVGAALGWCPTLIIILQICYEIFVRIVSRFVRCVLWFVACFRMLNERVIEYELGHGLAHGLRNDVVVQVGGGDGDGNGSGRVSRGRVRDSNDRYEDAAFTTCMDYAGWSAIMMGSVGAACGRILLLIFS